tara:strand:+ start:4264 stop:4545 length:282 start_codon:yes stop_codon:yes gene_type:complete
MSNEDWDQFIIIDEQPYYKNSNKNTNLYCFKTPTIEIEKNTNKVPGDFSINDVINNSKKNNSYIELFMNTSANFVRKFIFSFCYLGIKYIYTI